MTLRLIRYSPRELTQMDKRRRFLCFDKLSYCEIGSDRVYCRLDSEALRHCSTFNCCKVDSLAALAQATPSPTHFLARALDTFILPFSALISFLLLFFLRYCAFRQSPRTSRYRSVLRGGRRGATRYSSLLISRELRQLGGTRPRASPLTRVHWHFGLKITNR